MSLLVERAVALPRLENLPKEVKREEFSEFLEKIKDDPTVTKGYFPHKRGKTGRQKAWAYMTDSTGKIQQLLALEYGCGKMKLHHCLPFSERSETFIAGENCETSWTTEAR
jgi:hypothetical protein